MKEDKKLDILAVGDIAIDVFIKIKEAEEKCDPSGHHCELCLNYGGKIPYESSEICYAVGNSSNVAIGVSKLGLKSGLMTNMGDDQNGINCIDVLRTQGVDTNFVKIELNKPTNCHYILWYKSERTILTKHEKYNYEWTKTKESEEYHSPSWIYLSSLGDNSLRFYDEIINYLKRHTKVKLAFQPGTFQIKLGTEKLGEIYKRTNIFICNKEEAQKILGTEETDIPKLLKMISELGPKVVIITDGLSGSYSYDGSEVLFMKTLPHEPFETTGAGDSFSASFISALSLGKNVKEALMWGTVNAMSVVMKIGPHEGLLTREQIEEKLKTITEDYQPIKI